MVSYELLHDGKKVEEVLGRTWKWASLVRRAWWQKQSSAARRKLCKVFDSFYHILAEFFFTLVIKTSALVKSIDTTESRHKHLDIMSRLNGRRNKYINDTSIKIKCTYYSDTQYLLIFNVYQCQYCDRFKRFCFSKNIINKVFTLLSKFLLYFQNIWFVSNRVFFVVSRVMTYLVINMEILV